MSLGKPGIMRFPAPANDGAEFTPAERDIILEINQRVAAANTIEELIDYVFPRLSRLLPCDRIGLSFLEEDGQRLVAHYSVANFDTLILTKGFAQDIRGSSLEMVIHKGVPRIINNLEIYLKEHPESVSTKLIVREGSRSSMTCPLIVDGRTIGLLFFSSREPHAYQDRHVFLQQAIAERFAQAADKAHRIEQLQHANRAYLEMLDFIGHELSQPVASMISGAELLASDELSRDQRAQAERIARKGRYLLDLVRDYLDLALIERGEAGVGFKPIDNFVGDVFWPAVEMAREQIDERRMQLECDFPSEPCALTGEQALLRVVVVNLVGNAVKYGNPGGKVRIGLHVIGGKHLELSVWNEGQGFPPEKQSELFRRFSRLDTPASMQQKGTGLGLYSCWKIVQQHHGRIWARSQPGAWAEFTFRIPLTPEKENAKANTAWP